ncbi:MAG: ATPase [Hyphomicrobium sp.]|nr:ATPase [Hyphomicrobium sp.]PPC83961.1 MAG: ATPase [Hyphomicrobium sp.]
MSDRDKPGAERDKPGAERDKPGGGEPASASADAPAKVLGREPLRPPLIKRFYTLAEVTADDGPPHRVLLDGRPVRTPKKQLLAMPSRDLAEAVAAEWAAQGVEINPASMPLTRMVNTTLDGVLGNEDALRDDIAAFAMSDLLCYRAEGPSDLVARQAEAWGPVIAWAEAALGCRFVLGAGLMPVAQPEPNQGKVLAALARYDAFRLTPLHVMTTLTGSALLALATAERALTVDAAWAAAHVDEDFQIGQWGEDEEAITRRARRYAEMSAAARLLALVG